ncbi:MAG: prevent-host-death family protein [Armatimonadetes bacterium]|nr:prevent-host-death family protein [Armatimonadota bacterium]
METSREHAVLSASAARAAWREMLNRVLYSGERIIIDRYNDRAAVVPLADLELLEQLEEALDVARAEEALADTDGRCTLDEVRQRLGL